MEDFDCSDINDEYSGPNPLFGLGWVLQTAVVVARVARDSGVWLLLNSQDIRLVE